MQKKINASNDDIIRAAALIDMDGCRYDLATNTLEIPDEKADEITKLLADTKLLKEKELESLKTSLCQKTDAAAEKERQKYITGGSGQSMTYTEKFNQAVEYSKNWQAHMKNPAQEPEPNENDYLLLKAGLGIDGSTLIEVAATVTYAYAVWQQIGAAIEGARLKAKMAISEAKTAEDAQTIFAAIKWPKIEKQDNAAPTT